MKKYSEMSREELLALKKELDQQFADIKAQGLSLDMSRGKPGMDQLDISMEMMDVLKGDSDLKCETGVDCRTTACRTVFRKPNDFWERSPKWILTTSLSSATPV